MHPVSSSWHDIGCTEEKHDLVRVNAADFLTVFFKCEGREGKGRAGQGRVGNFAAASGFQMAAAPPMTTATTAEDARQADAARTPPPRRAAILLAPGENMAYPD